MQNHETTEKSSRASLVDCSGDHPRTGDQLRILPLLGVNPIESLKIMLSETFADKFSMGNILVKTTPLILTSLAFAFTYKANLYNIGAQGQFYVGCICAVAVTLQLQTKVPRTCGSDRCLPCKYDRWRSYRIYHWFSQSKIQCK